MGGTVVRTYSISVARGDDLPRRPSHVLGPGQFNEEAFRALDLVLQAANEQHIRLIIPLVNNWTWQGGRGEYAGFRGKSKDDFWTDPQLIADFEDPIRFVLTRTNTLTGVRYGDDKAILCWETGNELSSPASLDGKSPPSSKALITNHLVMDGFDAGIRARISEPARRGHRDDPSLSQPMTTRSLGSRFATMPRAVGKRPTSSASLDLLKRRRWGRHASHHGKPGYRRAALEPSFPRPRRGLLLAQ